MTHLEGLNYSGSWAGNPKVGQQGSIRGKIEPAADTLFRSTMSGSRTLSGGTLSTARGVLFPLTSNMGFFFFFLQPHLRHMEVPRLSSSDPRPDPSMSATNNTPHSNTGSLTQ